MDFGTWLADRLKEQHISKYELARKSGLSHTTINNVIAGKYSPTFRFCIKIAEPLGYDPASMIKIAGILLLKSDKPDPETQELIANLERLSEDDQEEVRQIVRMKAGRHGKKQTKTG